MNKKDKISNEIKAAQIAADGEIEAAKITSRGKIVSALITSIGLIIIALISVITIYLSKPHPIGIKTPTTNHSSIVKKN